MLTQAQLDARLKCVTGSDAAVICGLSPFKTKLQLWMEKTGRTVQDDISGLNHIKFGNFFEQGVADWFSSDTGKIFVKAPDMLIHSQHEWMAGNIDFKIEGENAILECKTAFNDEGWGNGENIIPSYYLMQVAHYCAVGNFDRAYIAVVFAAKREMRWYQYDRNLELEEKLIAREKAFWFDHVLADVAPEPVNEKDILTLYKEAKVDPIIADEQIESHIKLLNIFNQELKDHQTRVDALKEQIQLYMLDHDTLIDNSGKILACWKYTNPIKFFDRITFKLENKELYDKYEIMGDPQRRFTIKGDKQ